MQLTNGGCFFIKNAILPLFYIKIRKIRWYHLSFPTTSFYIQITWHLKVKMPLEVPILFFGPKTALPKLWPFFTWNILFSELLNKLMAPFGPFPASFIVSPKRFLNTQRYHPATLISIFRRLGPLKCYKLKNRVSNKVMH